MCVFGRSGENHVLPARRERIRFRVGSSQVDVTGRSTAVEMLFSARELVTQERLTFRNNLEIVSGTDGTSDSVLISMNGYEKGTPMSAPLLG